MSTGIASLTVGEVFTGFLLVKSGVKAVARNGKPYINATIGDSTGDIPAMIWDADEEKESIFSNGNIVKVQGTIEEFQGRKQIKIAQYRLSTADDSVEVTDFIETAPIDVVKALNSIEETIDTMENEIIRDITRTIFEKHEEKFRVYPAAQSMHHASHNGLLHHTSSMLALGKQIASLYPLLNKDILFSGIILHDIKKVIEYEYNNDGANATFTLEGQLLGHIVMISEEVSKVALELGYEDEEVVLLLKTVLLSHHGKNEWGSPVVPRTVEGIALHHIDNLDAKMEMARVALESVDKGQFSEKVFGLDNQAIYNHKL